MAVSYGFQEGFQRDGVVYGGNGFFGRVIVNELLRRSTTQIEIAARTAHSVEYAGYDYRVRFVESDLRLQNWLDQRHDFSRYVINRRSFASRTLAKQSTIWLQNRPGVTHLYSGRGKRGCRPLHGTTLLADTNLCQGLAPLLHHQRLAHSPKHSTCARVPRRVARVS